jgi:hypothetical protein
MRRPGVVRKRAYVEPTATGRAATAKATSLPALLEAHRRRRGEFVDDSVSYIRAPGDAVRLDIARDQLGVDGNLEGGHLRRLTLGDRTVRWVTPGFRTMRSLSEPWCCP